MNDTIVCAECGKTRKAHYDNIYCYAATRKIHGVVYVAPIKKFVYVPKENK